ncbi:MAG: chemotaxis protein CheX [Cellulomonadaceae bacterium]|nr:chemotaxis protein CheX [Cellulomonadaceae bacterium]
MSSSIDTSVFAGTDPIFAIAEELFGSMIDGEPGYLSPWHGPTPVIDDEMFAFVDVGGEHPGRVLMSTHRDTAMQITRQLLMMEPGETVGDADFVDALGEVANVVGGNVKALVPDPGALTLPVVTRERPETRPDALVHESVMDWRGNPLIISIWGLA